MKIFTYMNILGTLQVCAGHDTVLHAGTVSDIAGAYHPWSLPTECCFFHSLPAECYCFFQFCDHKKTPSKGKFCFPFEEPPS